MPKALKKSILAFFIALTLTPFSSLANDVSEAYICKAAIATIMNQDVETIRIDRIQKQFSHVSFFDMQDKIKWEFKCLLEGSRVQWATKMGNWRNTRLDSVIDYEIKDDMVHIQESHRNGSIFEKEFNKKELSSDHDIDRQ